ncbi:hypothetical protein M9458_053925, partial [Cirrhinus mrigala]
VHENIRIGICSGTEAEFVYGLDEEEFWHADYNHKRGVETVPDFGDPVFFDGYYDFSVGEIETCRNNLAICTKAFKSPPPEM